MYILENTQDTKDYNPYSIHSTYAEAAREAIDSLNGDYDNDFWLDENSMLCKNEWSGLDFCINIYETVEEAIEALENMDEDCRIFYLEKLAIALANKTKTE